MEYEIAFDTDSALAIVRTGGVARLEDFSALLRALVSDSRWQRGMDVLSDHTALDAGELTAGDVEALVGVHLPFAHAIGPGMCAVVAGSSLKFGLARMFEAHAERLLPFRMRVFTSTEEAFIWLRGGVEEPELELLETSEGVALPESS
jgi:hypothetical protein